jgi:hypothetical protein
MSNTLHLSVVNDSTSYAARRALALELIGRHIGHHAAALRLICRAAARSERSRFGTRYTSDDVKECCGQVAQHDRNGWLDELRSSPRVTISGRRWFQRTYGNTYCTARIQCDRFAINLPKEYGYGDYWAQRCREFLRDNGFTGEIVNCGASDVLRERDL